MNKDQSPINFNFIINAELLPLMEKANNGCFDSLIEVVSYLDDNPIERNLETTLHYHHLIFKNSNDLRVKLAALWNSAISYKDAGRYNDMEKQFHVAIDFMQENIPMEDWDFSLFYLMEEFTQWDE